MADINQLSPGQVRALEIFPVWMRESNLLQQWAILIDDEVTLRLSDLIDQVAMETKPHLAGDIMLSAWENNLGLPVNVGESEALRRANILNKISRRIRYRESDIATIIRFFLTIDEIVFTTQTAEDQNFVFVNRTDTFRSGETVYVGNQRRTIQNIDRIRNIIFLDNNVDSLVYEIIAPDSLVDVRVNYNSYSFAVILDTSQLNLVSRQLLVDRMLETVPAHLAFTISSSATEYTDSTVLYDGTRAGQTEKETYTGGFDQIYPVVP